MKKEKNKNKKTGHTVREHGRDGFWKRKKRGGRKRNGKQRSLKDDESQVLEAFSKFASCRAATFILKPSESVCLPLVFYKGSVDGFSLERIEPVK